MNAEPIVYVVDDDANVIDSISFALDSVGLARKSYSSAESFLKEYDDTQLGCLVLDVRMEGMSGLELQKRLIEQGHDIPIIFLTAHGDVDMCAEAMKRGATYFLPKPVRMQKLLDHVQAAIESERLADPIRCEQREFERRLKLLSKREREVFELVVDGLTSNEVGDRLSIVQKTVDSHRGHIYDKMENRNVPHLIRLMTRYRESKR